MRNNKFALQILMFTLIVLSFIACDKDFATLESDVLNTDVATSFRIESEPSDVITYTKLLGPVQTNNFGSNVTGGDINTLGVYDDVYGRTTASFVAQLTTSSFDPDFGEQVQLDSVVLTIPYFSVAESIDDDGNITYDVDSILPKADTYKDIKLSLFESNYFIRDFDPNAEFNEDRKSIFQINRHQLQK